MNHAILLLPIALIIASALVASRSSSTPALYMPLPGTAAGIGTNGMADKYRALGLELCGKTAA